MNLQNPKKIGWGFSVEGRFNAGNPSNFILPEGYGKFRLGIFELKAGRTREITGLCDTLLSSGSWSISGNALGIPKIQLSIPEFYTLPFLGRLFAFKGNYMHGWMGNWYIQDKYVPGTASYLHQKSLYGRFGKSEWKLKLYGGFNHQVVWGQEKRTLGNEYDLNPLQTFLYVNIGKAYSRDSIQNTRLGDQLGSIDMGLTYEFKNVRIFIYRQNLYDAGALYYLANLRDGLNGLSIVNKVENGKAIQWKKFLLEFLYTKNQAGETWSPKTTSPYENYYNNGYYRAGWSYKGSGLGNPFISPARSIKAGLPESSSDFFANNRVMAFHMAGEVSFYNWIIITKLSFSKNYGTYLTSPDGKIYNGKNTEALNGIFPETDQFSGFLEAGRQLKKGFRMVFACAIDQGDLYKNTFGLIGSISKTF